VVILVEVESRCLGRQPFARLGVINERLSEVQLTDMLMVSREGLPGLTLGQWCYCGGHLRPPYFSSGTLLASCHSSKML
jgi:hypothetical protein